MTEKRFDQDSPHSQPPKIHLPLEVEGAVYFVDEAGSKGSLGKHFVTAAIRTTDPDHLARALKSCRQRLRFTRAEEIKFSKVTARSLPILTDFFHTAVHSECSFGAFVLDKRHFDPWSNRNQWEGHLFATERLLRGMITRRELSVVAMDHIDVPENISYGQELSGRMNERFRNKRVISALSLDSRTCPSLQVADLLASAVYHARTKIEVNGLDHFLDDQTPKALLSKAIGASLQSSRFADCDTGTFKLQTSHPGSLTELAERRKLAGGESAVVTD